MIWNTKEQCALENILVKFTHLLISFLAREGDCLIIIIIYHYILDSITSEK